MNQTPESLILETIIRHAQIGNGNQTDYIESTSSAISSELTQYNALQSEKFPISEKLFLDWISKNANPISWDSKVVPTDKIKILSWKEFEEINDTHWRIIYSFTRPGIFENRAIVQISAYCPAGPPNYSTAFLLENQNGNWIITSSKGLYNQ